MYTRTYPDRMSDVPEGYKGAAMSEGEMADTGYIGAGANPWENRETEQASVEASKSVSGISGILGGLFQNGKFSLQSVGFEELLIIAAAAYMLLSREGDRTCGIMLLVLLFIS